MPSLTSLNPFSQETVGAVPVTGVDEMPEIVARARAAQGAWGARTFSERAALLRRAGERLATSADEIGRLATLEMGKPLGQAQGEARYAASAFADDLAEIEAALAPEVVESESIRSTVYHDPFGVAACIAPWNFPVLMPQTGDSRARWQGPADRSRRRRCCGGGKVRNA